MPFCGGDGESIPNGGRNEGRDHCRKYEKSVSNKYIIEKQNGKQNLKRRGQAVGKWRLSGDQTAGLELIVNVFSAKIRRQTSETTEFGESEVTKVIVESPTKYRMYSIDFKQKHKLHSMDDDES